VVLNQSHDVVSRPKFKELFLVSLGPLFDNEQVRGRVSHPDPLDFGEILLNLQLLLGLVSELNNLVFELKEVEIKHLF